MKRKFLALLSALCLSTSLLPTAALAAETTEEVKIPDVPATECTCTTACTDGNKNTSCPYCKQTDIPAKNCTIGANNKIYPIESHKSLQWNNEITKAEESLRAAVNISSTALKGKVLQLQEDVTITTSANELTIPTGTSVILDLNGYTLTMGSGIVPISLTGTLTLRDSAGGGSIVGNLGAVNILPGGHFILESGTLTTKLSSAVGVAGKFEMKGGTIQNCTGSNGSVLVSDSGIFTISDNAKIIGANSTGFDICIRETTGTMYANGGSIRGKIQNNGTMYADGGSIQGQIQNTGTITQTSNTKGTDFSMATFTADSTGSLLFASETSLLTQMSLSGGDETQITLGNDIALTKAFEMPEYANIILDLNGCAITGQSIQVNGTNYLTIVDSSPNKTTHTLADGTTVSGGLITSDLINDGSVILTSGTLTNLFIEEGKDFYAEGGTILQTVQNGGTISRSVDDSGEPDDTIGFTTFSGTVTNSYNGSTGTINPNACMCVTFHDGTSDAITAPQFILKGQKASDPNITRNGMTATWYRDKTRWDFSTPITDDLALNATWCYPIVIESTGHGTVTPSDSLVAPGKPVSLRVEPEEGYQLASLVLTYTPPTSLEEEDNSSGTIVVEDNQFLMPDGPVSGKASFERCRYTVTYDLAFGENPIFTTSTALYGDLISAPTSNPTRSGYIFFGWYNGNTKWDFATDVVTGSLTLVAKWLPVSSSSGGSGSSNSSSIGDTILSGILANNQLTGFESGDSSSLISSKQGDTITISAPDPTLIKEDIQKMLDAYQEETQPTPPQEDAPAQDDTPAQEDGVVIEKEEPSFLIDASQEKNVATTTIDSTTIHTLKDLSSIGLTVAFSGGTVHMDSTAVQQLNPTESMSVSVQAVSQEDLTSEQKAILEQAQCHAATVVDVSVLADGENQTHFGDGTLTISVPARVVQDGLTDKEQMLSMWYIREDNSIERMEGRYDSETDRYIFYTNHLSRYILVYPEEPLPFTDVPMESYYYPAVLWAVENDITTGFTETTFAPDESCTRAQIVTFLWRSAGEPQPTLPENPFSDIKTGAYYENAVLWAVENGITTGTTETTFSPEAPCTREQTATILYRFAQAQGEDVSAGEDTNLLSFADAETASPYAIPALQWAVGTNILQGDGENLLPKAPCSRAQIVTMLWRESVL